MTKAFRVFRQHQTTCWARPESAFRTFFLPFCGIDPWKGQAAVNEIRRCYDTWGVRGVGELNPGRQEFFPDNPRFDPIWDVCSELGLIVMFHMGFMGGGAGTPGGMGYRLEYTRPIPHLDNLAARFPGLQIIGAHPGWPWHLEALAVAWHKSNFFIDLSGWAPRYWPADVVHYANSVITEKMLFGSDWPAIPVERWLDEFDELGLKDEAKQKILLGNALKLLAVGS